MAAADVLIAPSPPDDRSGQEETPGQKIQKDRGYVGDPICRSMRPEEPLSILANQDLMDESRPRRDKIRDDPGKREDDEHECPKRGPHPAPCRSAAFKSSRDGRRHKGSQSWRSLAQHRSPEARIAAEE